MSDHDDDSQSVRSRQRRRQNDQSSSYHYDSLPPTLGAGWKLDELTTAARSIMNEYIGAVRCIPPQIIVRCRGDNHAYARAALKSGGYNMRRSSALVPLSLACLYASVNKFTSRFARAEDYSEASFLGIRYMASPDVRLYATFYPRCHHHHEGVPAGGNGGFEGVGREGARNAAEGVPRNDDPGLEGPVSIDREGWAELIDNVAFLDVMVMRRA
ncbi:hypothetical protein HYDPIDRAFT_25468 [Hydnomerulius pinastri MD-312]|nr:hypothetical protein HYDPIDRAFT_25468 [Hydnomerulius pinastri MD-312]